MKLISKLIIFSVLIVYAFAAINIVEKRGIISEPIIFEVEVKAPCEAYLSRVINSIQISRVTSPTCLPISPVNSTQDINDYHAHVFCTNTIRGRSLFRFHEIFVVEEDETPAPGSQFIVSWLSEFPFVEKTRRYSYARRPTCSIGTDVCSTLQIVNQCYDNYVDLRKGYVSSSDRVYFIPPSVTVGTCSLNDNCCPYISTAAAGICGGQEVDPCSLVNCDDSNLCTIDTCSGGNCTNTPISCDDGNACTTDTCNPLTGCVHTPISCDDGFLCTTDTCNPSTGCVHTQRTCSSNDFCQINSRCDNSTGNCITDPRVCTGSNLCADSAFCNSTSQACQDVPKVCPNNACFLNGVCNVTTGACAFTRLSCNDNDACTNNRCDNTTGCYFPPVQCSDNNTCSVDYCNPTTGTCFNIFFCSNTDECNDRVCTNECPSPPALCPADPTTTLALSNSVISARFALSCNVTFIGGPNCRRKNPETTLLGESPSIVDEQPKQVTEQKKEKKKRPSLFSFIGSIFSSKKKKN